MYEVDNRYPEVMPLYSKVGKGKSYGALSGAAALTKARRAARINNLKRSFWTSASAVVLILALLVTGGAREPEAADFLVPTLEILSAEQSRENPDELLFTYQVELNDAQAADVTVIARTEDGEILGTAGPFHHGTSGSSMQMHMQISRPIGLEKLKLELTADYVRDGVTEHLNAETEVSLEQTPPEPTVTEPGPAPDSSTEPTEPAETPTLRIVSCVLNGSNVTPLQYRYEVELAGAEVMEVRAEITDQEGGPLGSDGPWTHTESEASPELETPLEWETRPTELTLTLTGSYEENGETKTLTAAQTLAVPEEPFLAPTLTITDAELPDPEGTPLSWRCQATLNSAQELEVRAEITDPDGNLLGADGPFLHTDSEESPQWETDLEWETRPKEILLTLTGTYTEKGETKTVTASQTLVMPEAPFVTPTLTITSASLNGSDVSPLSYRYRVRLNSAESMRVRATVTSNSGVQLGTDGPYTHGESGTSPTRSAALTWSTRPTSVILTLTGTYTEKGTTKTVTATQTLKVDAPPFTAPTLTIASAALNGNDAGQLNYTYRVRLNSADSLQIRASITSNNGTQVGSGGPYTHTESGTSPARSATLRWTTRPTSVTLTLTGTYTENGTTKTVTAAQRLTVPEEPFTAPKLNLVSATLNGSNVTPLSYSYRVTLNSAASMQVRATVTSNSGAQLGSDGPYTHNSSGASPTRTAALSWTTRPTSVTLTLTGTYTEKGTTKTLTATQTLNVPEEPFTAPTLTIASASLNGTDVTPLTYTAQVNLNSASSMQIRAAVSSNTGVSLGTDGPFTQSASGTTASRQVSLGWTERPTSVTLTLTGTYTENGTTKTLTATRTLTVPEAPFQDPTLSIETAELVSIYGLLRYNYTLTVNDPTQVEVQAEFTYHDSLTDETKVFYTDAAQTHDATITTDIREIDDAMLDLDRPFTLTLTGTYKTPAGETRTVTDSKELEDVFVEPEIQITSAKKDGSTRNVVVYNAVLLPNSAYTMDVTVSVDDADNGDNYLTEGPETCYGEEVRTDQRLGAPGSDGHNLILTISGTYERDGASYEIQDSMPVDEIVFEEPSLILTDLERGANANDVVYSFDVTYNSAPSMEVVARFYSAADELIYTAAAVNCEGQESFGPFTVDTGSLTSYVVLTGTYAYLGNTHTLTASGTLPSPFRAPTIQDFYAEAPPCTDPSNPEIFYKYYLDLGDADQVSLTVQVVGNGTVVATDGPEVRTATDYYDGAFPATVPDGLDRLTVRITGVYLQDGVEKTITDSMDVSLVMEPTYFDSGGEALLEGGGSSAYLELWVEFTPDVHDPHRENYDFEVTEMIANWYDDGGNLLSSSKVTDNPAADVTVEYVDSSYSFEYKGSTSKPDAAVQCSVEFRIRDRSTGRMYFTTTYAIDIV
ncbi:MAG: hypothetical protein IKQ04_00860 [Oscillospiraceae bacterium]|nr:hypothetical protein [Oscillospiraceae bacterium]